MIELITKITILILNILVVLNVVVDQDREKKIIDSLLLITIYLSLFATMYLV